MKSLANLSNMHSQKFSAFRWVLVEKRDCESLQARLQDCLWNAVCIKNTPYHM